MVTKMKEKDIIEELAYKLLYGKTKIKLVDKQTNEKITTVDIIKNYMTDPQKKHVCFKRFRHCFQ